MSLQNYDNRRPRSRKNIRKNRFEKEKPGAGFMIGSIILGILMVALSMVLFASIQKGKQANAGMGEAANTAPLTDPEKHAETESPAASEKQGETENSGTERVIMIGHIPVTGLSQKEAKQKLLDAYRWDIKLSYRDSVKELENPLPKSLDILLGEIYNQEESLWQENYELDTASVESSIREQVAAAASQWNRDPSRTQLTGRDKEKGTWIYTSGEKGIRINQEAAVQEIMNLINEKKFTAAIAVQAEETAPEQSIEEVKKSYQVIGTFSTTAASNNNRNNNIRLAMNALDGLVIFPGEEFSFNKTTGNRTTQRGYLAAGAYRNGEFVEEPGGGVCQVSSTLYNAIIFSGLKTTERNPHSFEPSYVIPGEDAMVSYDGYSGPDLRFVNKQNTSVAIRAVFQDNKLTISIIGMPILEEGVKVSMRSQKTKEYDPPEPNYEEDQTLQPQQEIVVQEGVKGTTWKTWLVTSKDGTVVNEEYFHTSTYRGKPGVVKRNTTGVVIPVPSEPETAPVPGETAPVETLPEETEPAEGTPSGGPLDHAVTEVPVKDNDIPEISSPEGGAPTLPSDENQFGPGVQ